jgi:hypothetical protein
MRWDDLDGTGCNMHTGSGSSLQRMEGGPDRTDGTRRATHPFPVRSLLHRPGLLLATDQGLLAASAGLDPILLTGHLLDDRDVEQWDLSPLMNRKPDPPDKP